MLIEKGQQLLKIVTVAMEFNNYISKAFGSLELNELSTWLIMTYLNMTYLHCCSNDKFGKFELISTIAIDLSKRNNC